MREGIVSLVLSAVLFLGALLRYLPFASEVTPRKKKILFTIYIAAIVPAFCSCWVATITYGVDCFFAFLKVAGTIYAVAMTFVNLALISNRTREHLFVLGVVLFCFSLLQTIPTYICSQFHENTGENHVYLWVAVYAVLQGFLFPLLKKMLHNTIVPFLRMESGGYWNTVCFIPAAYYCANTLLVGSVETVDPGIQLISSLISALLIVLLCISISQDHKRMQDHATAETQLEAQKLHYTELQIRVENARKIRHDFKHHLAAIRHYMDTDDKQGLRDYCDELLGTRMEAQPLPYTGNSAADGVLYHHLQQAKRDGIELEYKGTIQSDGISDSDLSVLLGNALDNARAGCMTIAEGRRITLISQTEPHLLTLLIRNTFDGNVSAKEDTLLSRKRENRAGVGISSMQHICQKYGGTLDLNWDEKNFTTIILLPRSGSAEHP